MSDARRAQTVGRLARWCMDPERWGSTTSPSNCWTSTAGWPTICLPIISTAMSALLPPARRCLSCGCWVLRTTADTSQPSLAGHIASPTSSRPRAVSRSCASIASDSSRLRSVRSREPRWAYRSPWRKPRRRRSDSAGVAGAGGSREIEGCAAGFPPLRKR